MDTANMLETQADAERKPRKSVAFSEGTTIVDSDGQVTESTEVNGGKSTAESHSGLPSPPAGEMPSRVQGAHADEANYRHCRQGGR
jgi:hypothetical protein